MQKTKKTAIISFLLCIAMTLSAQRNEIFSSDIATLQVHNTQQLRAMLPVIQLNSGEQIQISFDNFRHEYHRFTYKITHCEADWSPSTQLFSSDYLEGFSDNLVIENIQESVNTNVEYTHYSFRLPNDQCRITQSGNYKVSIYDEDEKLMLNAYFMVVDPTMHVELSSTSNTDIDFNRAHQQVEMKLKYGNLPVIAPYNQIKTVVLQNGNWNDARVNMKPQFVLRDGLQWQHCRGFIFDAGNNYRKFECLSVDHPTMGIETIDWDGSNYHAHLWPDLPRRNYLYDESAQGVFVIRNSDDNGNDYLSDYVIVHFTLQTDATNDGIYVSGGFTNYRLLPQYQMKYDAVTRNYTLSLLMKQGYYSYEYVRRNADGSIQLLPSEGNFYQTKNQYQALIYYRGTGERTDRLVAVVQ
ncbi:hypothetical protein HMPREF0971_00061 [Segatella oris F0302]|uniref:Type 9 secretion system plug protein N-terminal domain-containing protein n=1 Tax=Segatella oris F0302 TaxID=649760 RepID=D1QMQ3_9BACT|nr:DUF5103 domain-containing protein [Segatella oris]EFB33302.1 hypothetical protein HMPREF0971_00061 [Segatella oris F0302]MBF1448572.1 DUF5103 domain-containing protein [Segatella oris]